MGENYLLAVRLSTYFKVRLNVISLKNVNDKSHRLYQPSITEHHYATQKKPTAQTSFKRFWRSIFPKIFGTHRRHLNNSGVFVLKVSQQRQEPVSSPKFFNLRHDVGTLQILIVVRQEPMQSSMR